jgi:hypothetical protein
MSEALGRIQAAAKRTGGYSRSVLADDLREVVARVARLEAALIEVGDFLADDCVDNYPFDRIPGSFADEADRLLKLIKQVTDKPTAPAKDMEK